MFPLFTTRCLHVRHDVRDPSGGSEKCGREWCPVILPKWRLPRNLGILLHAANLRHGTDGFTSTPKEGVLRIFSTLKVRRFRQGLNPRTWVLKATPRPPKPVLIIIIGGILILFIYTTRLVSKEIFSTSNKIHREVGRTKDLSAPRYVHFGCYTGFIYGKDSHYLNQLRNPLWERDP